MVKRGLHTLRQDAFQLVVILPGVVQGGAEYEAGKLWELLQLV